MYIFNKFTLSTAKVLMCYLGLMVLEHGTHLNMPLIEVQRVSGKLVLFCNLVRGSLLERLWGRGGDRRKAGRQGERGRRRERRKECSANRTKDIRVDQMISFITTLLPTLKEWGLHLPDRAPLGSPRSRL